MLDEIGPGSAMSCGPCSVTLCLSKLVPPTWAKEESNNSDVGIRSPLNAVKFVPCDLGADIINVLCSLNWHLFVDVGPLYAYEDMVPAALSIVHSSCLDVFRTDAMYHIFLDGSHDGKYNDVDRSTWAFAVVSHDTNGFCYHGAMAGRVCCSPDHHNYLGAESKNSITAELSAMCWSLCWAISMALKTSSCAVKPRIFQL